jgi:outer membrane protein OmpA-like peptidoglycan-associated protein
MRYCDLPKAGLILAGGLALAACSSAPPQNAALNQARATYSSAAGDPEVTRYGAYPLAEAQENLGMAQQALNDGYPTSDVTHHANLANTQSQIAMAMAKRRVAEAGSGTSIAAITLGDMNFQVGKANLSPQGKAAVDQIAGVLRNNPDRNVTLNGYTDSTGSLKFNQKLSVERAQAVQNQLVADGVDPQRLTIQGHGPDNPVASNATASGRARNRRVTADFSAPMVAGVGSTTPPQSAPPQER